MAVEYVTSEGDTADYVAWSYYKTAAADVVQRLLEANPGLADRGPILPAGVTLTLPDLPVTAKQQAVRLWD